MSWWTMRIVRAINFANVSFLATWGTYSWIPWPLSSILTALEVVRPSAEIVFSGESKEMLLFPAVEEKYG